MARSPSKSRRTRTKVRREKRGAPASAVLLVVLVAAATFLILHFTRSESARQWLKTSFKRQETSDPALFALRVEQAARGALTDLGVADEQLSIEGVEADGTSSGAKVWEAPLPPGVSLEEANLAVTEAVELVAGRIVDGLEWKTRRTSRRCLKLTVAADSLPCLELHLYEVPQGKQGRASSPARLAIVVGGLGTELDDLTMRVIGFPSPLTVAVLPGYPVSQRTAQLAEARGKEVLLHLPMEPSGYPRLDAGKGAILLDDSPREIRRRVRGHLKELGCASGVVNYMGSAAMRDRDVMRTVLQEIKKARLFFLDSTASVHSVAKATAAELEVPCFANDLFLEEGAEGSSLLVRRIERAESIALDRGKAVVMARSSEALLEILTSRAGDYGSRGIILVRISDLLEDS